MFYTDVVIIYIFNYHTNMADIVFAEVLILILLLPVVLRPLFRRSHQVDSIVLLSPVSLLCAVLVLIAFGIHFSTLIAFIMSFVVFLTNGRAFVRFTGKLYVDYYKVPFRIVSFIEGFLIALCILMLFIWGPKKIEPTKTYPITGSYSRTITERKGYTSSTDGFIYEFDTKEPLFSNLMILLIPSQYSNGEDFFPLLQNLSIMGLPSVTYNSFVKDIPYFGNWLDSPRIRSFALIFKHPVGDFNRKKTMEVQMILSFLEEQYPNKKWILLTEPNLKNVVESMVETDSRLFIGNYVEDLYPSVLLTHPMNLFMTGNQKKIFTDQKTEKENVLKKARQIVSFAEMTYKGQEIK
jgi:hypothetical protein